MKFVNLGIITFPISKGGLIPLRNLVDILCSESKNLYLITGGAGYNFYIKRQDIHTYQINHNEKISPKFARILNYVQTQIKMSWYITKLVKRVDIWIFFIGGESLILPMVTARILKKGAVIISAGSGSKVAQAKGDSLAGILAILEGICYCLANKIIVYSERLIPENKSQKYKNKILIAQKHFVDLGKFNARQKLANREYLVGYIGSLSKTKGVPNLLKAMSLILAKRSNVKFLLGGAGELKDEVMRYLIKENLNNKVQFVGWISHDKIPCYLNKLKLLVLPSYTEGLPNIILEAMACGTPVLATAVGAIPDIIIDSKTGFIMRDNTPEHIAQNILRALDHSNLDGIAKNARILIENEYTYEAATIKYKKILDGV